MPLFILSIIIIALLLTNNNNTIKTLLLPIVFNVEWLFNLIKKIAELNKDKFEICPYDDTRISKFFAFTCKCFYENTQLLITKQLQLCLLLVHQYKNNITPLHKRANNKVGGINCCLYYKDISFKFCCGKK